MILLTLTIGSRNYFVPESPSLQMIVWCTEGFRRYSPMFSRDSLLVAFAIPYHRYIPMDKYLHLSFLLSFPAALVITRCIELFSTFKNLLSYCLAVPCHLNTPTENSSHLSRIHSSPVVHAFHKILRNAIWSSKNPLQLSDLEILVACCIVVNSICLAIFFDVLCHYHLESLDSIRVWLLIIISWSLGIIFLAQTSFEIWADFP